MNTASKIVVGLIITELLVLGCDYAKHDQPEKPIEEKKEDLKCTREYPCMWVNK